MSLTTSKPGVLLVNLGSPDSTSVPDVRRYLDEFLSDSRVIDVPKPIQQLVVKLAVLPFRPAESAEAYEKIWGPDGSPLITTTENVTEELDRRVEPPVAMGMRYGNPSIADGVDRLVGRGADEIFLVPLYPHFAMSSYETVVAKAQDVLDARDDDLDLTVQPPFYDDPDYIDTLVDSASAYLEQDFDYILFSYHGVPERHITKRDPTGCYCLEMEDCCSRDLPVHDICYRHQVFETTWRFVEKAGIPEDKYGVSFQSRLGPDQWLEPFTDETLEQLPSQGVKDLLIISPAFVSDCLETLEELGIEGEETFLEAGGESFELIPCLNEHPDWIALLERFVGDFLDDEELDRPMVRAAE